MNVKALHSEEQEVWSSFVSGDNKSLEVIYRRYFDELYQYGNKWLKNPTLTQDSIQDLFVKIMRNRLNLSTPQSVKYYLLRSFRSIVLDKLKSDGKITFTDEPGELHFQMDLCPEQQMISRQEDQLSRKRLSEALNQLTARQREAIFLKYQEGLSYPEIAEILSLTQKATYKLIARAIQTLRIVTQASLIMMMACLNLTYCPV